MSEKSLQRDLTQGSVGKNMMIYAVPLLASNLLQAVYNIVDMVVVGNVIGGAGMSAVSIGGDVLHLLTFLAMGFSNAGQVLISQLVGAGNRQKEMKDLIGTMFVFLIGISLIIAVVCSFCGNAILGVLKTPAEAWDFCRSYMITCIVGLPFIYGYNLVCAILRGMGDSKRPFVFICIASILNIVLDIVFVRYMNMSVFGAALATVIGQAVSFLCSLVYLVKHKDSFGFDFKRSSFIIEKKSLKSLVSLGIPMAIQSAAVMITKMVVLAWTNAAGVIYSALMGVYNKIGVCMNVVAQSFTMAGNTMCGQAIGAGKFDRVYKILGLATLGSGVIGMIIGGALLLCPDAVYGIFTPDPEVLASAYLLTLPCLINCLGTVGRTFSFSLINGSGNSKLNLIVAIIDGIIGRYGLAYFFGFTLNMSCQGFWLGDAAAGCIPFFIGLVFLLSGKWKVRRHAE